MSHVTAILSVISHPQGTIRGVYVCENMNMPIGLTHLDIFNVQLCKPHISLCCLGVNFKVIYSMNMWSVEFVL